MQQLLRTLNLNSPGPLSPSLPSQEFGSVSISPDVSPISTTSALLTPPELSPAKAYGEWKFNPTYDFNSTYQSQNNNALLFETDPQHRYPEVLSKATSAGFRPSVVLPAESFHPSGRSFSAFEPFSDRQLFPPGEAFPRLDSSSRQDPGLLHPSWSHQRVRTSSADWLKAEDRRGYEPGVIADVTTSPSQASRSHTSAHEVSVCASLQVESVFIVTNT